MKSPKLVFALTIFLLLAVALHFALTTVYSLGLAPGTVNDISQAYTVPLFHQNWRMFAPDVPEYHTEMEYRTFSNAAWSDWNDVCESNGIDDHSKLEYIEQSLNSSLGYQIANNLYVRDFRKEFERITGSFDFHNASFFALRMHQLGHQQAVPDSLQLRLKFDFTPVPGNAPTGQFSYFEFPAKYTKQ